ncbi:MAG: type II toxin-antitoxin system VapB family antitoxin [Acidobacteriota bacterium]
MDAMKTTVNIPDRELEEAMISTGARTKKEAVVAALVEFNRRRRLEVLASQLGTFEGFPSPKDVERLRGEG